MNGTATLPWRICLASMAGLCLYAVASHILLLLDQPLAVWLLPVCLLAPLATFRNLNRSGARTKKGRAAASSRANPLSREAQEGLRRALVDRPVEVQAIA